MNHPTNQEDAQLQGLPPGTVLPDAHVYRLGQFKARLMVSVCALLVLVLLFLLYPSQRIMTAICSGLMLLLTVFHAIFYVREKRKSTT